MGKDNPKSPRELGLETAERHVFLCAGPDCCATTEGLATWETLKDEIKKARLPVLRTKAACLRLCQKGPWMVVYPEGVWYDQISPEKCKRIVKQHLIDGAPVVEWVVARSPLGCQGSAEGTEP